MASRTNQEQGMSIFDFSRSTEEMNDITFELEKLKRKYEKKLTELTEKESQIDFEIRNEIALINKDFVREAKVVIDRSIREIKAEWSSELRGILDALDGKVGDVNSVIESIQEQQAQINELKKQIELLR